MNWLLLVYKVPREPTSCRVYVWRKLKQLGAVSVQDAIWVLPANPRTQEHFQWLAAEIIELDGEVSLFQSTILLASDSDALQGEFEKLIRKPYDKILRALNRKSPDLAALSKLYQQTKERDYFQSDLGEQVRKKLLKAKGPRK
jgi:hypothetical protein